jgi:molybdopterin converting factor small subunit
MNVTVKYQGMIGDMLRRKTQQLKVTHGATIADLLVAITASDEHSQTILKQSTAFIDGKQADRAAPLSDGAEVTFMRPIAGGSAGFSRC